MTRVASRLNPADHAALAAVRASGRIGLSADEIRTILGLPGEHAPEYFAKRARDRGHPVRAIRVSLDRQAKAFRYIVEGAPTAPATGDLRAVTRLVTTEIGMGSTPGTPVSVAYLSCLDAAPASRALGGEGSV